MIRKLLKNYRDKNLLLIRKQVYDLVKKDSRVVDLGCGDGELLRILSSKISYGFGLDKNRKVINWTRRLTRKKGIKNLYFEVANAEENLSEEFDYGILMFVLHSLDYNSQNKVLNNTKRNSEEIIIVDYKVPIRNRSLVYLDELIAGHYRNFINFKQKGIENLITKYEKLDTERKEIGIWIVE